MVRYFNSVSVLLNRLLRPESAIYPCRSGSTLGGNNRIPAREEKPRDSGTIRFAGPGEKEKKEYSIKDFERFANFTYLPGLEFQDEKTFRRIRKQCSHVLRKELIDGERKWLGAFHAAKIKSHYVANLSIRWIDETLGYGLFAEESIKASEYIGEYTGVVRRRRYFSNKNDYSFLYPTSFFYLRKHIIDGKDQGNEIRYANHSDDPNCEAISVVCDDLFHIILRAVTDIPAHTQITYDYSRRFWKYKRRVPNIIDAMEMRSTIVGGHSSLANSDK